MSVECFRRLSDFCKVTPTLHFCQLCLRVPVPQSPPQLSLSVFDYGHSGGYEMVFHSVVCISLVTNDAQHLFICLFSIHVSSFQNFDSFSFIYFVKILKHCIILWFHAGFWARFTIWIRLGCGGCAVYWRIFSIIPGFNLVSRSDN